MEASFDERYVGWIERDQVVRTRRDHRSGRYDVSDIRSGFVVGQGLTVEELETWTEERTASTEAAAVL